MVKGLTHIYLLELYVYVCIHVCKHVYLYLEKLLTLCL